jgi:hypothetical protein
MNVGIGTEAAQFLFWEYINWIFDTKQWLAKLPTLGICKPIDKSYGSESCVRTHPRICEVLRTTGRTLEFLYIPTYRSLSPFFTAYS